MSTPKLNQIQQLLPSLSEEELEDLQKSIKGLSSVGGGAVKENKETGSDEELVLECISTTLRDLGVEFTSLSNLGKGQHRDAFRRKVPDLMQYLQNGGLKNRMEYRAALQIGIELLYRHMMSMGIPVSSRALMAHIHRIPSLLNLHLPGYAENGNLNWIIRK